VRGGERSTVKKICTKDKKKRRLKKEWDMKRKRKWTDEKIRRKDT
jgi:hypothetical protein